MTREKAVQLLRDSGYLYDFEEDEKKQIELNMNDVWGWALAWGEAITPDNVVEVGELFQLYGWCGLLYWASEQHEQMRSEFEDVNRRVEFVRHEEELRRAGPHSDDPSRCAVCGWPLEESPHAGCVRGNCSQRPLPNRAYAPERGRKEYGETWPFRGN